MTNNTEIQFSICLPIIHCEADFKKPIHLGDSLNVSLFPKKINRSSFEISTIFSLCKEEVAIGLIRHVSINSSTRQRCDLPEEILSWLQSSN